MLYLSETNILIRTMGSCLLQAPLTKPRLRFGDLDSVGPSSARFPSRPRENPILPLGLPLLHLSRKEVGLHVCEAPIVILCVFKSIKFYLDVKDGRLCGHQ